MYQMERVRPEVEVPVYEDIVDEINKIVTDLALGEALRERALFRLWRVHRDQSYTQIVADEQDSMLPKYPTWTAFMADFCESAGISRASVYSRIKTYYQLEWVGYTELEMLQMMTRKPGLYERVLGRLLSWDSARNEPTDLKTDRLGEFDDMDDAREPIMELLEDLDGHERINDALSYVDNTILGRPHVHMSVQNGIIVLKYSEDDITAVDGSAGQVEEVQFLPDKDAPAWVFDEIQRRYNLKIINDDTYVP